MKPPVCMQEQFKWSIPSSCNSSCMPSTNESESISTKESTILSASLHLNPIDSLSDSSFGVHNPLLNALRHSNVDGPSPLPMTSSELQRTNTRLQHRKHNVTFRSIVEEIELDQFKAKLERVRLKVSFKTKNTRLS